MLKLSKRLQLVVSFIDDNSNIIDVGCDHAYLAIYLAETKKNINIIASDINPNPLKIAKENIKKYHLENKIKIELKDGINNKTNLSNIKTIILSPNNEFITVRKKLKKIGFKIIKEKLITENKQTYLVIKAIQGKNNINNYFGILDNKDLESIYYYTKILNTNTKILKNIPKKYIIKRIKLILENKKIIKFLNNKK